MDIKQNWYNKIRQRFLLTFFTGDEYQEKEVNGFIIIKQFSKRQMSWEVAIYTKESFQKRNAHKNKIKDLLLSRGNKQERV